MDNDLHSNNINKEISNLVEKLNDIEQKRKTYEDAVDVIKNTCDDVPEIKIIIIDSRLQTIGYNIGQMQKYLIEINNTLLSGKVPHTEENKYYYDDLQEFIIREIDMADMFIKRCDDPIIDIESHLSEISEYEYLPTDQNHAILINDKIDTQNIIIRRNGEYID